MFLREEEIGDLFKKEKKTHIKGVKLNKTETDIITSEDVKVAIFYTN